MSESLVDKWEKWCDKIGYDCQNAYDAAMIDARRDDARELKVRDAEIRTLLGRLSFQIRTSGDRDATKAFDMILALLDGQPEEGKRG